MTQLYTPVKNHISALDAWLLKFKCVGRSILKEQFNLKFTSSAISFPSSILIALSLWSSKRPKNLSNNRKKNPQQWCFTKIEIQLLNKIYRFYSDVWNINFLLNYICQLHHSPEGCVHLLRDRRFVLMTAPNVNVNGVLCSAVMLLA